MPDLKQSLQGRDIGHLRIVAELWGVDFNAPDVRSGIRRLAPILLNAELVEEVLETLPQPALNALRDLLQNNAKLSWAMFARRYGDVREMGPAKRDREYPYLNASASPAEALWYRALVGRTFLNTPKGPEEYAFIPEDLLEFIPVNVIEGPAPLGRPASPAERVVTILADDSLLDDACTLLAALRVGVSEDDVAGLLLCAQNGPLPLIIGPLTALLRAAGLLDENGLPKPEETRQFLEADRGDALLQLVNVWLRSADFDEMHFLPGVTIEGEWQSDPVQTRRAILDFLSSIPFTRDRPDKRGDTISKPDGNNLFWSLQAFIGAVKAAHPDFQRPAGDYDSWYLRDAASGDYLRGFQYWDRVDGDLIRYLIAGPMHWLGLVDLSTPSEPDIETAPQATGFRFTQLAASLLNKQAPEGLDSEEEKITIRADGRVRVPVRAPRAARYQAARFGEWQGFKDGFYRFRLTPAALQRAGRQGLRVDHLLALLRRHAAAAPPSLIRALQRWENDGSQASLMRVSVLRVRDAAILTSLRKSPVARFLGDVLGPTSVVVRDGAIEKVMMALAEMGYLAEIVQEEKR
ncbi:helicase-associated domain-containing protein [Chloroflexota bacterium]